MSVQIIFWLCAAFILYGYVGYPLVLAFLCLFLSRPVRKQPCKPAVSLLISAYNEAHVIENKLRSALQADYPPERLEVVVASDGSSDETVSLVQSFIEANPCRCVRLLAFPHNRGKLATLNEVVPQLQGDIVVFSDAASIIAPDAIRRLVENFNDPTVGAASGVYQVLNQDKAQLGRQEDFYWRYETFLKLQEAKLGSTLGAHGSLYAIRKELYSFPAPGTINDDFIIPMRVLEQGFRVAYDPSAVATEEAKEMEGFGRRVRIMAGNFLQLKELRRLLRPPRPLYVFFLLSHKAVRLMAPAAMILLAVATTVLWSSPLYRFLGLLQIGFYALAVVGAIWPLQPKFLRLPYYFCMINTAVFPGIYRAIRMRSTPASWS